ncbi:unnamed protein product [Paramecium pentaurelia]|uniref:Uncharacterized protein n=1 Tax=Paramecium pentaurelia TaxID=43138 RepID=A0A8S1YI79_9CILI|nr:unnamed protein product [Paramecium pentaurelia]
MNEIEEQYFTIKSLEDGYINLAKTTCVEEQKSNKMDRLIGGFEQQLINKLQSSIQKWIFIQGMLQFFFNFQISQKDIVPMDQDQPFL